MKKTLFIVENFTKQELALFSKRLADPEATFVIMNIRPEIIEVDV